MRLSTLLVAATVSLSGAAPANAGEQKLRVICFGAHPDDCELKAGGVAALWAAEGHRVKFVSVTNGDIGHWRESGPALALREWHADLVLSHRPNDYHPDHRYTAVLVQDAAYMVTVPKFLPEVRVGGCGRFQVRACLASRR
jgi:LmbE family N-acetylglucosaminyl deacetylase